jgi:hypothetical protein
MIAVRDGIIRVPPQFTRGAVKVDAVHGFDNPKAFGNAIHLGIERAIHLRKLGRAGVFAPGTPKNFHPMVVICHPASMPLTKSAAIKQVIPPNQIEKRLWQRAVRGYLGAPSQKN